MYLIIIGLPLLSFLLCSGLGRYLGRQGVSWMATSFIGTTALLSAMAFYEVSLAQSPVYLFGIPWISMLGISWGFLFDSLTVVMLWVITAISAMVHLYSIDYMKEDPHLPRFMSYLSLFTFFMILLVTSDNLISLFVGWEGVGISSYLLINFWYTRIQANKSAMKAILVNRIGDVGLMLALLLIYATFKTFHFDTLFSLIPYVKDQTWSLVGLEWNRLTIIALCLFIGVIGKSAQLGLHIWLPDAMEGPTPVSALIHAATMVTAGVFLMVRMSPLFESASSILVLVTCLGALTTFVAATIGLCQNDIKKVIAYSTCSQLGYMVFACGLSQYAASMYHMMNHAYFKALLFLTAGSVIHALHDEQDMRRMGGLVKLIPLSYTFLLIGSLSLMGFPFLTGFYSKDYILELAQTPISFHATWAYWLGTLTAFLTAFYSIRLLSLTFLSLPRSSKYSIQTIHESSFNMLIPLGVLTLGSIYGGYLCKDLMIGLGTPFWNHSLYLESFHMISVESEWLSPYLKWVPVLMSVGGMSLAWIGYEYLISWIVSWTLVWKSIYAFFQQKWYIDLLIMKGLVHPLVSMGYQVTFKLIDRGILEHLGPYGLVTHIRWISHRMSQLYTGYVYHSALIILIGVTFYLGIIFLDGDVKSLWIGWITWVLFQWICELE